MRVCICELQQYIHQKVFDMLVVGVGLALYHSDDVEDNENR